VRVHAPFNLRPCALNDFFFLHARLVFRRLIPVEGAECEQIEECQGRQKNEVSEESEEIDKYEKLKSVKRVKRVKRTKVYTTKECSCYVMIIA
jgi:hypothetical protein